MFHFFSHLLHSFLPGMEGERLSGCCFPAVNDGILLQTPLTSYVAVKAFFSGEQEKNFCMIRPPRFIQVKKGGGFVPWRKKELGI